MDDSCLGTLDDLTDDELMLLALDNNDEAGKLWVERRFGGRPEAPAAE